MGSEVIVVPVIFISIVWLIDRLVNRRALSRERLKMIEKDRNLDDLKPENRKSKSSDLKYGLIAISLAVGVLVGSVLDKSGLLSTEVGYTFSIALFVGLALILSHYLEDKEDQTK